MLSLKYFLFFLSVLFSMNLGAQANTLIRGTISGSGPIKLVELKVNTRYLDGEVDEYFSNILEDGSFAFAIDLDFPQLVSISHGQSKGFVYLEPGDSLYIRTDALNFQRVFEFSDKSGANNRYLVDYYKRNPIESNPFKLVQYKQGIHWFDISPEMDSKMRNFKTEEYLDFLTARKDDALKHLIEYQQLNANVLSSSFISFIETEIVFDWAYHVLAHGHIYRKIKDIQANYFDFLNGFNISSDQIGNYSYRRFLMALTDRLYLDTDQKGIDPYSGQFDLAESRFHGLAKDFVQSEMISTGFAKKYIEETIPHYNQFIESSQSEFQEKVVSAFEKSMQNAVGSQASNFKITNKEQESISLNSLQGKTVYLNFWASWCQPCVKKMVQLQKIEKELDESNIKFVHISFDRSPSIWETTIKQYDFKGIHALAIEGVNSDLAKAYGVRSIPQYFLIGKDGKFANKPTTNTFEELKKTLDRLSKN